MTHENSPQAYHVHVKHHWTHGWPLFLLVCALTAATYAFSSYWPVLGLLLLLALMIPHKKAAPKQDGEVSKAAKGTGF